LPELQRPTSLAVQVPGGSAPKSGAETVKKALSGLRHGRSPHVFEVDTPDQMTKLFEELSRGGKPITPSRYRGTMVELSDGTTVGMRTTSKSGGPTIDIKTPDNVEIKVHLP
jgi:hypothetical protein